MLDSVNEPILSKSNIQKLGHSKVCILNLNFRSYLDWLKIYKSTDLDKFDIFYCHLKQ